MKFRVHLFRELQETYEVEAENADEAFHYVDSNLDDLIPKSSEVLTYLPDACIDPLNSDGSVDYDNSVWRE